MNKTTGSSHEIGVLAGWGTAGVRRSASVSHYGSAVHAAAGCDSNVPEGKLEKLLMWVDREIVVTAIAVMVQVLGVVGVVVARLSQRSGAGGWSIGIAVACVVLVGMVSLGTMETCERGWMIFATTMPLMAVGATIDLRKPGTRAAF